ncbi:23S rRNA (uracil(1939)-C(5))-methyltransferase RlmD [Arenicella chitinivorans]|uniref:23S rRNA (uracil(1939)-C(5))-methyltransferase RlmD n=1 Tax=Arenicella chitinivorans TaxID=1329800 RepID=A0A918RJR0_9GAMM|nr:23S rRNA (uracil(1939)-C(5))-methyltransferase RlmD [Arenicella chitinivorans]GGZ99054.1 23S rRNA (uracil(1939)-C(5))-methyltransferase RlmD [Arenicella chitinivorans]
MARRRRRARKQLDLTPREIQIDSLAHDGRGVGRGEDGKVVFVDFALPGERVKYVPVMNRKSYLFGTTIEVLEASPHRIEPKCAVFGQCGGCVLQHLEPEKQIHYKQQALLENFKKIGDVQPETLLAPMVGPQWGYRRRARLGAKFVPKKGGMIVGFRERNSSYIQPTERCEVLYPQVSNLIPALRDTLGKISCNDKLPQVEISVADNATVMILRHLETLLQQDLDLLTAFAKQHEIQLFLQPGNLKSVHPLYPPSPEPLYYRFDAFDITVEFLPTDFIQVNGGINDRLVATAIELLDLQETDRVLDLFCGVGNFTLPLARCAAHVVGVEGDRALVDRADHNKALNKLNNLEFHFGDLFKEDMTSESHGGWLEQSFDKVLLDPPRSGAAEMVKRIPQFNPSKIVYVSCGPATLARDAGVLVNEHGYRMTHAGVIDMFPHTAHVESIAVFEKD